MIKSSSRLGSLVIVVLVVFLCHLDDIVSQWQIYPERTMILRASVPKASITGYKEVVQETPRFVQRHFHCLYPSDENMQTSSSSLCGCPVERRDAATSAAGVMSMLHAETPLERRTLIPPNSTFSAVNRTEILRGFGLSLEWEHWQGYLSVWHCRSSIPPTLTRMDARGWTFRVMALNNEVQMTLNIHHASHDDGGYDSSFQLTFPEGAPYGLYNITVILLHVDHQGKQDPHCFQNLTVRTHCKGETLWFDNFVKHVVFENVEYWHSSDQQLQQQTLSLSQSSLRATTLKPPCKSLDQLTPGYFHETLDGDWIWTPAHCLWNATLTTEAATAAAPTTGTTTTPKERVLLVGDSTFRHLASAASDFADYRQVLTPHDFRDSLNAGMYRASRWPNNTRTLIFSMGLHSTCYNNLQQDLDLLPDLIHALVDQWTSSSSADQHHQVIIRSTIATALKKGIDFNAKKCLYYTDTRLRSWNNKLRELAAELNVTFWDEYNITASVGPSPGEWAATDGTHYCYPDPESSLCRQLVAMVRFAMR